MIRILCGLLAVLGAGACMATPGNQATGQVAMHTYALSISYQAARKGLQRQQAHAFELVITVMRRQTRQFAIQYSLSGRIGN